jgi:hypothetical protein
VKHYLMQNAHCLAGQISYPLVHECAVQYSKKRSNIGDLDTAIQKCAYLASLGPRRLCLHDQITNTGANPPPGVLKFVVWP